MPIYTIETPSGRKLDIEAADEATAMRGAQEWHAQQQQPQGAQSTNIGAALRHGAAGFIGGVGETLDQYTNASGVAQALKSTAESLAPTNYQSAQVITSEGVNPSELPRAVAEAAPGLGASIAAARLASRLGLFPALAAGAVTGALASLGPQAKARAQARTGDAEAAPSTADKAVAATAAIPQAVLGALALRRFLSGVGATPHVGFQGATQALKNTAVTAGVEGGVAAGQDAIAQVARTAGNESGLTVDPISLANSAVVGGVTGGALASPKAAKDTYVSTRLRKFGGDMEEASSAVANRLASVSGGVLDDPKKAFETLNSVHRDVAREIVTAARALEKAQRQQGTGVLDTEALNALARAKARGRIYGNDISALERGAEHPEGQRVLNLVKQAKVLADLKDTPAYDKGHRRFVGGVSGLAERGLRAVFNPLSATASATSAALGASGVVPALSLAPSIAAPVYGSYLAARAVDRLTGDRAPLKQFVEKFANPAIPVRAQPQATPRTTSVSASNPDPVAKAKKLAEVAALTRKYGASDNRAESAEEAPFSDTLRFTTVNAMDRTIGLQASSEFASANPRTPRATVERYRESAAQRQARIRDRLIEASGAPTFPADDLRLGEALDKIRSLRSLDQLAAHVADVAARFPESAQVIKRYFGPEWARTFGVRKPEGWAHGYPGAHNCNPPAVPEAAQLVLSAA